MAGNIRNLLERSGRYYARKVVPSELRAIIGSREITKALGADRRHALQSLPAALASIHARLDHARQVLATQLAHTSDQANRRLQPMSPEELARVHYNERLALDDYLRNESPAWASIGIDDRYVAQLRQAIAGRLTDIEVTALLGQELNRFRLRGNITAESGTSEWRRFARALAAADYEALERVYQRDEGLVLKAEDHPLHLRQEEATPDPEAFVEPLSLRGLLETYLQELEASGRGRAARKAWKPVFEDLVSHVRKQRGLSGRNGIQADDARKLTKSEVSAWRDARLETLSPRTVKDVYLASLKAVLNRATENDLLNENVAALVKVRAPSRALTREQGYTTPEATSILIHCAQYVPALRDNPANQESVHVTAAKKWGPWLCAFTGARIGEILQLRRADIRQEGDTYIARITPDAGTVKARSFRDVPLHPQLVELGFADYISTKTGPLFYAPNADPKTLPAMAVGARVGKWIQEAGLVPEGVSPNHGWRHRFKTLGRELEIDSSILDALQGHASITAGDRYGDVTLNAKKAAILKLPHYAVQGHVG